MSGELALGQAALTFLAANGSALAIVYRWLTAPIEARITSLASDVDKLSKRIEKVEDYTNPRSSMSDAPTLGEIVRRLEALEEHRGEMQEFRGQVVTDEEFRSYTSMAGGKLEDIVSKLGWIKGRLGGKDDD